MALVVGKVAKNCSLLARSGTKVHNISAPNFANLQPVAALISTVGKPSSRGPQTTFTVHHKPQSKFYEKFKGFVEALCNQTSTRNYTNPVNLPRAAYGGIHTVTLLPGDGVGPELMKHVEEVFRYAGAPVVFEKIKLDSSVTEEQDLENALLAIKRNGTALKGNIETREGPGVKSRNVELRAELDLFANVVHCRSIPGVHTRHNDIDIAIIRENTEGEYSSLEHLSVGGVVESLKIITARKSKRIAKYAFDFAVRHGRKKVTCVHKANIMKLGDGLFLESCRQVSEMYPNIEFEGMIVDNASMQLVSRPQQFDVVVLPNLYGNIIANIGAGLVGGPGLVPGVNIGEDFAVFETATRNTGLNIAGKNIANPSAMLLASADMLTHLGLSHGKVIRDAVYSVLSEDMVHTPDLGGQATTTDVVQAVIEKVKANSKQNWYA